MSNTVIQLKSSGTPSNIPSNLANGEIALNFADGKFYYKNVTGQIVSFAGSGNVYSFATINANNSLITALSNNSVLTINPGQNIGITSDIINDIITISANLKPAFDVANAAYNTANSVSAGNSIPAFNQANQAYLVANTKTFTFMQGTPPSTANANDLWANNITGVVYENWGTTSSPVWAEFGPTTPQSSVPAGVVSFSELTVTGNTTVGKQLFVNYTPATTTNAAAEISAANTKGGTGYADVLKLTNISPSIPNPIKWIRINTLGALEIVNSAYNMVCATLTDTGALTTSGAITPGAWTPGQVIKDTMLSNSELTVSATTVATSTSDTDFVSYSYTPVSSSSYLIIHMHVARYDALTSSGTGVDSYFSRIKVDGNEIVYGWQYTKDTYTFRSGVLFPLTGRYTNSSTSAKTITVGVRRDTADDNITITNSPTALWMRITEIAR
jgi:hypothetical protein